MGGKGGDGGQTARRKLDVTSCNLWRCNRRANQKSQPGKRDNLDRFGKTEVDSQRVKKIATKRRMTKKRRSGWQTVREGNVARHTSGNPKPA